jgi:hypothetical protein
MQPNRDIVSRWTPKVKRVVLEFEDDGQGPMMATIDANDILAADVEHRIPAFSPSEPAVLTVGLTMIVRQFTVIRPIVVEDKKEWEVVEQDAEASEPSGEEGLEMGDTRREDGTIEYREQWMGDG